MLVAAAVCPCPPLIVPEVAAGAAPELDTVRAACAAAVEVLAAGLPDLLVVVGPTDHGGSGPYPAGTPGSFRGYGVDVGVRLGGAADADRPGHEGHGPGQHTPEQRGGRAGQHGRLPPSLAVGAWLLERARWSAAPVEGMGVRKTLGVEECLAAGDEIAHRSARVGLLVMGDASACRTLKAPGYLDERATGFDAGVARALGAADVTALKGLDAGLAQELQAAGRAPWQVLAGAARGVDLTGRLLHDEAPYGVGYLVAAWS